MSAGPAPEEGGADNGLSPSEAYLEISVSEPVKQGEGVNAYVSYKVQHKTNMINYRVTSYHVIRRFSDFSWLHDQLADKTKGIIIPPLPEKNVVEKFRFSADFIEARRRALDVFLNRVATHPLLRASDDLKLFLEASEDVWAMETARASESALFKKKPSDFMQMFKDMQTSLSNVVMGKDKPEEVVDVEYEKLMKYIEALEEHLLEAQKQSLRLVKRQRDLGQALADFGESVVQLGLSDGGPLGKAFSELGARAEVLSMKAQQQSSTLLLTFEEPLKEYTRMTLEVKAVMSDRSQAIKQYQELLLDIENKRTRLGRMRQANPQVKPERIQEQERDLQETTRRSELAKERYDLIVERMGHEMKRFQAEKTKDLSNVASSIC